MVVFSFVLDSALDHSATFLTDLARRTVKNWRSPRGPRFEPGRPQTKIHRSISSISYFLLQRCQPTHSELVAGKWRFLRLLIWMVESIDYFCSVLANSSFFLKNREIMSFKCFNLLTLSELTWLFPNKSCYFQIKL